MASDPSFAENAANRVAMLRFLSSRVGHRARITTVETGVLEGVFRGCDADQTKFLVSELKTRLGVVPSASIDSKDILRIDFFRGEGEE
jgi:hypothetical protein